MPATPAHRDPEGVSYLAPSLAKTSVLSKVPFPVDEPGDDAFLAHVERVLTAKTPLPGPKPVAAGAEKRRNPRRKARNGAQVEVRRSSRGLGPNRAVALLDVCEEGIGVCLTVPFQPGEAVAVVLVVPGGTRTIKSAGEVRWCAAVGDGTYRAGVRLHRQLGTGKKYGRANGPG
jgi:PilZ domain